jgi:hypothetical protein
MMSAMMISAMTISAMTMAAMMTAATMMVTMTMAETKETTAIRSDEWVRAGILIELSVLSRRINNRTGAPAPPVAQPRGANRCNRA